MTLRRTSAGETEQLRPAGMLSFVASFSACLARRCCTISVIIYLFLLLQLSPAKLKRPEPIRSAVGGIGTSEISEVTRTVRAPPVLRSSDKSCRPPVSTSVGRVGGGKIAGSSGESEKNLIRKP